MSGLEALGAVVGVVSVVAQIVSAYRDGGSIIENIKRQRAARRGLPVPTNLEQSIREAAEDIERENHRGLTKFGQAFEQGDYVTVIALQQIVIKVQKDLLEKLKRAYDDDEDVENLESATHDAAVAKDVAVQVLVDLQQRLAASMPDGAPGFESPPVSTTESNKRTNMGDAQTTTSPQGYGSAHHPPINTAKAGTPEVTSIHKPREPSRFSGLFRRSKEKAHGGPPSETRGARESQSTSSYDNVLLKNSERGTSASDTQSVHLSVPPSSASLPHPDPSNDYLGFCKGARRLQDGDSKAIVASRDYTQSAQTSIKIMRCSECKFEGHFNPDTVWNQIFKFDNMKIRWAFLAKSHVRQKYPQQRDLASACDYTYQCIFCAFLGIQERAIRGAQAYKDHVSQRHHGVPLNDVILYKAGAVDDRICDDQEEWDINLYPKRTKSLPDMAQDAESEHMIEEKERRVRQEEPQSIIREEEDHPKHPGKFDPTLEEKSEQRFGDSSPVYTVPSEGIDLLEHSFEYPQAGSVPEVLHILNNEPPSLSQPILSSNGQQTDSGYASKSSGGKFRHEAEDTDTRSIRTDGRQYHLSADRKAALIAEFVTNVTENIDHVADLSRLMAKEATGAIDNLLRVFSILLLRSSTESAYEDAATFVRHGRAVIAEQIVQNLRAWRPSKGPTSKDRIEMLLWRTGVDSDPTASQIWTPEEENDTSDPDDTADMPPRLRDVDKAREIMLGSAEFTWLLCRLEQLNASHEAYASYEMTRNRIATALDQSTATHSFEMVLHWDPVKFLIQECSAATTPELSKIITYCGTADGAYAATTSDYLRWLWPDVADAVLSCIQSMCSEPASSVSANIAGSEMLANLENGEVCVGLTGNAKSVLEIAEACVWLSLACRTNEDEECVAYCTPHFSSGISGSSPATGLRVSAINSRIDLTDPHLIDSGICWMTMVRNPVIVKGYPIPPRSEPTIQKGLEIPLDMLVALSGANWATLFGQQLLLKGIVSALVPVLCSLTSITWHFLLNQNGERMTYHEACSMANGPETRDMYVDVLENRRHFVGIWTPSARVLAGSGNEALYPLKLSQSKSAAGYECELSNVSIGTGKYLNFSTSFTICRKDTAPALSFLESRPFERQMDHASQTSVLFYGTLDRRGWMLDGASALLHLARSWIASQTAQPMPKNGLKDLHCVDQLGGRDAAVTALITNATKEVDLLHRTGSEPVQNPPQSPTHGDEAESTISDSGYSTGRCSRVSKTTSGSTERWTFRDLVLDLWRVLEAMNDRIYSSRLDPPSITLSPRRAVSSSPFLVGWDAAEVVRGKRLISARAVELKADGADWIKLAREASTIVLMARTFGDLMVPKDEGQCIRMCRMPPQLDLLAIPLYMLEQFGERWLYDADSSSGCVQIADDLFWHGFDPRPGPCQCSEARECNVLSRIGSKAKQQKRTSRQKDSNLPFNIFERYPLGVALIGGPNRLKKCHKLPRLPVNLECRGMVTCERTDVLGQAPKVTTGEAESFADEGTDVQSSLASSSPQHSTFDQSRYSTEPKEPQKKHFIPRGGRPTPGTSIVPPSFRTGLAAAAFQASSFFGNSRQDNTLSSSDEENDEDGLEACL